MTSLASLIFCLPCAESIKSFYPQANISFLIHSSMQHLLSNNPFIHNIFFIDTESNLTKTLKKAQIDISISFISDRKSTLALFLAGVRIRIGIFSHLYSFLFNYKIKQPRHPFKKHETQYYLDLLKPLNCQGIFFPKLYLTIQQKQQAHKYLESRFSEKPDSHLIIICPSNDNNARGWLAKNFFAIADLLATEHTILLVTHPSERVGYSALLEQYAHLHAKNLYITADSNELLSIISCAKIFLSNNTLLLHCASALGIATVSLYLYTKYNNPLRYGIFSEKKNHIILTPFGIFSHRNLAEITKDFTQNELQGRRIEDIQPELVYNIIKTQVQQQ